MTAKTTLAATAETSETAYNNGILSESGRLMLESAIDNAK